jgi:hypothetical protein
MIRYVGFVATVVALVAAALFLLGGLPTSDAASAVGTATPFARSTATRPVAASSTAGQTPVPATSTPRPIQPAAVTVSATPTVPAMILVGPAETIPPGAMFDLALWFSSPAITRGAQFGLAFDPSKIQITGIDEGDYYHSWAAGNGATTMLFPGFQVDAQHGWVKVIGLTIMGGAGAPPYAGGPTGSGILATVHCLALPTASGSTGVTLEEVAVGIPTDKGITENVPTVQVTDTVLIIGSADRAAIRAATPMPRLVTTCPRCRP